MYLSRWFVFLVPTCLVAVLGVNLFSAEPAYVKKATRAETVVASLKAAGLPALDGKWYYIGPFDHPGDDGLNLAGDWAVYIAPEMPSAWPALVRKQLERDFPGKGKAPTAKDATAEAKHYKIVTLPIPKDIILEVGGLAMRPDGKLLACTRRGEVWLISNPNAEAPDKVQFKLFASGLHEALGLSVDGKDVYVVQRPELTKLIDRDGDDVAD